MEYGYSIEATALLAGCLRSEVEGLLYELNLAYQSLMMLYK